MPAGNLDMQPTHCIRSLPGAFAHNTRRGTPFTVPSSLSVVSYNLLAPLYVRPIDARTGCVQAFAA